MMIRVFIGYDHAESVAYHTLCHSINTRSSKPVSITPIMLSQLRHVHTRGREKLQSNEFSFSRFLVPYLCGYDGWAIFMDCDMLVLDDINKLWKMRDDRYAVQVVKHNHQPSEAVKYLGTIQTRYSMKNWTSVMLMNCAKCRNLTPGYVNRANGLALHQFEWLKDKEEIGDIPVSWNYLVDYYHHLGIEKISNLHYTKGGPYFNDFTDCEFAREWILEREDMLHCENSSFDLRVI